MGAGSSARVAIGLGGLLGVLVVEACWPFRRPVDQRWRRYLINFVIMGANALVLSVLLGGLLVAAYQALELHRVGWLHALGIESGANVAISVVALDFVTYWWHRAYHQVPMMWRLHRAHHSDLDLDVTSSGRFHLLEMLWSAGFRLVIIAGLGASLAGVVAFEIVFGLFNQLEHANLRLPGRLDAWLRAVVVTPDMHRVHHVQTKQDTNSNFGTIFSCWDRLFGTYRVRVDQATMPIGLAEYPTREDVTLVKVFAMPLGPACATLESARLLPSV